MRISQKNYSEDEQQFIKNIGFRIQFLRKKKGVSQMELAELADLSYASISHIESDTVYGLSLVTLYRIAEALEVEPYQLLRFD